MMTINQTASIECPAGNQRSLLPGILAAVAMLGFAGIQIAGMLAYHWRGSFVVFTLVVGAFVYFGAMGFQRWRAKRPCDAAPA
jgi:hypothetical protein